MFKYLAFTPVRSVSRPLQRCAHSFMKCHVRSHRSLIRLYMASSLCKRRLLVPDITAAPTLKYLGVRLHATAAIQLEKQQSEQAEQRYRTLAFYKFHSLPASCLTDWRSSLLTHLGELGVLGRIYISTEGINAQLSCPESVIDQLRSYCQSNIAPHVGGDLMDLNVATEGETAAFRALHVRIRKQLVADGLDPNSYDLTKQPSHLSPKEWHEKLIKYKETHGKEPILIDMRNHYESNIGYFEGAIRPDADDFKESIDAMNEICKDVPRDQEVFMYCTGGIRCSKAGAILQSQSGFDTVHLVEGGITAYGRWIQEQKHLQSLFRGRNFTFDGRMGETITDDITGTQCNICGEPCNRYQNCAHAQCDLLMICCPKCAIQFSNTCARFHCYDTVNNFLQYFNNNNIEITNPQRQYYDKAGPLLVDGVRAYAKDGYEVDKGRVVIGKDGAACEHEYRRRTRAIEVLGEPGQILKEWAKAGRKLPHISASASSASSAS